MATETKEAPNTTSAEAKERATAHLATVRSVKVFESLPPWAADLVRQTYEQAFQDGVVFEITRSVRIAP